MSEKNPQMKVTIVIGDVANPDSVVYFDRIAKAKVHTRTKDSVELDVPRYQLSDRYRESVQDQVVGYSLELTLEEGCKTHYTEVTPAVIRANSFNPDEADPAAALAIAYAEDYPLHGGDAVTYAHLLTLVNAYKRSQEELERLKARVRDILGEE